jgi:hypothetical protein
MIQYIIKIISDQRRSNLKIHKHDKRTLMYYRYPGKTVDKKGGLRWGWDGVDEVSERTGQRELLWRFFSE